MASNSQAVMLDMFQGYEAWLMRLLNEVAKKVKSKLAGSLDFLRQLAKHAAEIGQKIGSKAISSVGFMADSLVGAVDGLKAQIKRTLKFLRKILTVLRSSMNPAAMGKRVVALSKRFWGMFREVIDTVLSIFDAIDPITKILDMINSAKMMLQAIFKWIGGVGSAASSLTRVKMIIKKVQRPLVKLSKELRRAPREIRKLAAA